MLNSLLSLLILFSVKESKIAVSCPLGIGQGEVGVEYNDMIDGPSNFIVDWEENIYVLDSYNDKRIMKFDSTGKLLFTITKPESLVPNSLTGDTKNDLFVSGVSHNKFVTAKYSSDGKLLKVTQIPPAHLRSDLKGKIYETGKNFVFIFDEELNYLETFKDSEDKRTFRLGHRSQWTDWRIFKMKKDTITGKYNLGLRNLETKQEIALKPPPRRITYGCYIEGVDKDGNVYSHGYDSSPRQRIFFRINPIMQTIDTLRVERKVNGDIGLAHCISPNGEVYVACLVREAKKLKWFRIYCYSKNLFARME
jgi:hypothetical protein